MNCLVYEEARKSCEGCEMNDLSQLHHECLMTDEQELWLLHYEKAKKTTDQSDETVASN